MKEVTREQVTDKEIQMLIDSHENGTAMFLRVDAYYLMAKELQERRKAAMDSEPVAYMVRRHDGHEGTGMLIHAEYLQRYQDRGDYHYTPLYRHSQQSVVPPMQHWEELRREHPDMSIGDAIIRAAWWNHCRAAMLDQK